MVVVVVDVVVENQPRENCPANGKEFPRSVSFLWEEPQLFWLFLLNSNHHPEMAPRLAKAQIALISSMLSSGLFTNSEIATAANCSTRGVGRIRSNIRFHGASQAPPNSGGRKRSITPAMLDALCEHLLEKPGLYQSEMILFLMDEFDVLVTDSSIGRALRSRGWTKKQIRRIANGRNADLRDNYLYQISSLSPEHFVFVDESGCNKRIGFRRTGWSPIGTTPVQIARFQREQRYQILPAYTVDRIILVKYFREPQIANSLRSLSSSCFPYVVGGQSQNRCL